MAEVSKIISEKQDDPWNGERPDQDAKNKQTIITFHRISKRLAVETRSLYCSCSIIPSHHSCSLAAPDPKRVALTRFGSGAARLSLMLITAQKYACHSM